MTGAVWPLSRSFEMNDSTSHQTIIWGLSLYIFLDQWSSRSKDDQHPPLPRRPPLLPFLLSVLRSFFLFGFHSFCLCIFDNFGNSDADLFIYFVLSAHSVKESSPTCCCQQKTSNFVSLWANSQVCTSTSSRPVSLIMWPRQRFCTIPASSLSTTKY